MDKTRFLLEVRRLRGEGRSIRAIAAALGVHRNRVHRTLKELAEKPTGKPTVNANVDPFVGRQPEMVALRAALAEAFAGRGSLLMLAGEPGIGKTRTARELADVARALGAEVLWGHCSQDEGAPPYWPWIQVVRSCIDTGDSDTLRTQMGSGAADIGGIVPELQAKIPNLKRPSAVDSSAAARFRLFDSVSTFLKNAASSRPLVVALEDLHWSDRPSLLMLGHIAQEIVESKLLVVGTYRDKEVDRQHPLSDTLAQLSRVPVFQRLRLEGLSYEDTKQFVEMVAGGSPPLSLVRAI